MHYKNLCLNSHSYTELLDSVEKRQNYIDWFVSKQ